MATIGTIWAALKLIDGKKENLRKSLEDLQSQSLSLCSSPAIPFTWSDLDSHFTSLQSSLTNKFKLLQTLTLNPQSQPSTNPLRLPARPELRTFCEKMDGSSLLKYVIDQSISWKEIREELADAYRCAPDPAALVLDAVQGFYQNDYNFKLITVQNTCVWLLEELMGVKPEIKGVVKEKAMKIAVEWKRKKNNLIEVDKPLGVLGFLHIVAIYGLVYGFSMDELIDCVVFIAKRRQAIDLCRAIISPDRICDLIQRLISEEGKQVLAVRFSFEFEKTDKFPPVPLLKKYREETRKLAQKIGKRGKNALMSHNEAVQKELSALKSIIKCIEDYHLESEYPKGRMVHIVAALEEAKKSKKRASTAPAPAPKFQQLSKPKKPKGTQHPQIAAPAGPSAIPNSNSIVLPLQQAHPLPAGLLPDRPAQYVSSPGGPYGVASTTSAVPYTGSTATGSNFYPSGRNLAGPNGLTGAPLGFTSNPTPTGPNLYHSELHTPSSYYYRPVAYGGYGMPPQYLPSYHPQ